MNMLEILHNHYGFNNPIFISNVKHIKSLNKINPSTIRFNFHKLYEKKLISKFDNGIFYFPRKTILGLSTIIPEKVIERQFISNKNDVFGYYSGIKFENMLGLTTQNPLTLEIFSNEASGIKRVYRVGYLNVIVRKPYLEINKKNYKLLQFLNFVGESSINKLLSNLHNLKIYIRQNNLNFNLIGNQIGKIPSYIFKNLTILRLIYDLA